VRCCAGTFLETEDIHETTKGLSTPAREPHQYKGQVLTVEIQGVYNCGTTAVYGVYEYEKEKCTVQSVYE
jgi:hypothetical protein